MQGRTCAIDVNISTMSLLTGLRMKQLMEFLDMMKIETASRASFYRLQNIYINRIIWQFWIEMKEALLEKLRRSGKGLTVTGDGQA
jgi:hypothetical protein